MTITPGVGGSTGGPATPTPLETEQTAARTVAMAAMGLVADTLHQSLVEMGYNTYWKYNSTAGNPTIPVLNRLRVAMKASDQVDKVWIDAFEKMMQIIKEETRDALIRESRLPPELRNPAFGAFDQALGWLAKGDVWTERVGAPFTAEQLALSGLTASLGLKDAVFTGTISVGSDVVAAVSDYLNQVGHQAENFDLLMRFTGDIGQSLTNLQAGYPYVSRGG